MARSLIPNSTQIPDVILDHWMAALSGSEFKVLLYVARRTYGFGKDSDTISLNQLARGIRRRDGRIVDRGTGLSRSGVKAACVSLIEKGLLVRTANVVTESFEADESTYRLNLFAALPGDGEADDEVGQKLAYVGQKSTAGRPESDPEVGQKLAPQETDQETDQETAAAGDAAAELISELVKHGVSRRVAERHATAKPEVCKRCLSYLPFARIRTTSGAWLATAIEQEFGPPEAFIKAEDAKKRKRAPVSSTQDARQAAQAERESLLRLRLMRTMDQLSKSQPDAFTAFEKFRDSERQRARRFAKMLNEERQGQYLDSLDGEEQRLSAFETWLKEDGRKYRPILFETASGGGSSVNSEQP